jgi:hypothetical protein
MFKKYKSGLACAEAVIARRPAIVRTRRMVILTGNLFHSADALSCRGYLGR